MNAPQSASSPSRTPGGESIVSQPSLPMSYSMDSDPATPGRGGAAAAAAAPLAPGSRRSPPSQRREGGQLPPAYAFQRSERTASDARGGSFATHTTEDSFGASADSRSVDYTEDSTNSRGYEGLSQSERIRRQQMGGEENLDQYYEAQEGYLATVDEYSPGGRDAGYSPGGGTMDGVHDNDAGEEGDATRIIFQMHRKLLHLLSSPELFQEALEWQKKLDRGEHKDASGLATFETEFEDDSTMFRGLEDDDTHHSEQNDTKTAHAQDETFEFNPDGDDDDDDAKEDPKGSSPADPARDRPPLPHQIFAPDAEVVLPQALTASQLFGVERISGIELEAAAGVGGLSQLFLRWLALMPDGDHCNVVDPPGLTVMKIAGGGYRVTGAHRVVWRWMNKFSPSSTSFKDPITGKSTVDMDFDFGDLVTMTIVDVFETDARGRLLSYCPTFDNRAVHKTPEMAERLRKGAGRLMERMDAAARSPAGKSVERVAGGLGKMGFRAAMVMGNAVKNKMRHRDGQRCGANKDVPEEDRLNELLESQIASTDEAEADSSLDASALEEDPTSSPDRRMEV